MADGLRLTERVTIRACEPRDLAHFESFSSAPHLQYCRDEFARGEALAILLAVDADDRPVGKLHLDFEVKADERVAVLLAAVVAPSLRGRGIGSELMHAAEGLVRDRGFGIVELGVEDNNPDARRLYDDEFSWFSGEYEIISVMPLDVRGTISRIATEIGAQVMDIDRRFHKRLVVPLGY